LYRALETKFCVAGFSLRRITVYDDDDDVTVTAEELIAGHLFSNNPTLSTQLFATEIFCRVAKLHTARAQCSPGKSIWQYSVYANSFIS
jgi:hypothetical protein